jgi:hypothetical protein
MISPTVTVSLEIKPKIKPTKKRKIEKKEKEKYIAKTTWFYSNLFHKGSNKF